MGQVFITGVSSGLGMGLTQVYLDRGWAVYGLSRRGCDLEHEKLHQVNFDLADAEGLDAAMQRLLDSVQNLDLAILNAGILGEIRDLTDTPMEAIHEVMEINVWANKRLMDWLHRQIPAIGQIVLISSGAAVNGNRGWGAYSLSKATLNMLAKLYAHEFPATHICALAPGLVDTAMQDYLCDAGQVDAQAYPSVERLRNARGTEAMPAPAVAARRIADLIPDLTRFPSGSFQDVRSLG
ncbi:MAG: SDR family NAD(P)-dependent oxidoreductase [Gammaproteobacteria bacterium]